MQEVDKKRTDELFDEGTQIDQALKEAVQEALRDHKRAGNPVCAWRDGHIVWIPPEEIPVDEQLH